MAHKNVYLYVQETLADWEPSFVTPELNTGRYFRRAGEAQPVTTFGLSRAPIRTAGGLTIVPDLSIAEVRLEDAALLLLCGGDTWLDAVHEPVLALARRFLAAEVPVAAICGATAALAQGGFLDDVPHTSNDLGYLQAVCPAYRGEAHFVAEPAVTAGNLITASGVAPLEFAYQILMKLDVCRPETLDAWHKLYATHEPRYFYALMDSLPRQIPA